MRTVLPPKVEQLDAAWEVVRQHLRGHPRGVSPPARAEHLVEDRDGAAHGFVQGTRRTGRRGGDAGLRSRAGPWWPLRPAITASGWPMPRPSSGARSRWSCRSMPRRPRCRPCSSSMCGWSSTVTGTARPRRAPSRSWSEEGSRYVSPYNDPDVIAGQGTIARELLEQVPNLGTVVVPCGGGGPAGRHGARPGRDRRAGDRRRVRGVALGQRPPSLPVASSPITVEPDAGRRIGGQPGARGGHRRHRAGPARRGGHGERSRHSLGHGLRRSQDGTGARRCRCRRRGRRPGRLHRPGR